MTTAVATQANALTARIEQVLVQGDLKNLSVEERVAYYNRVCSSVGLNPFTRPLEYITLNGKLTLYARRDATDQLRKLHHVSIIDVQRVREDDLYMVFVTAQHPDGRTDMAIGAVSIAGLKGEALANALMKCETKGKRRVTLSICGLGMLDETETDGPDLDAPEPTQNGQNGQPAQDAAPDTRVITDAMRRRMFAIAGKHGHDTDEVRDWLKAQYGLASTNDLTRAQYDEVCVRLEQDAPLNPAPGAEDVVDGAVVDEPEPGSDG